LVRKVLIASKISPAHFWTAPFDIVSCPQIKQLFLANAFHRTKYRYLGITLILIIFNMGSSASSGLLPHPKVETSFGPIEGKRVLMPGGKAVANVFLGVPFAKPPVGERRFKVGV
jgi:hypothetical protein